MQFPETLSSAEVIMIAKCQVAGIYSSDASTDKKQSYDLCGGESSWDKELQLLASVKRMESGNFLFQVF